MATKAELEKELSKLREELSESKKMASSPRDIPEEPMAEEGVVDALVNGDIIASIEEGHLDTLFEQVAKEIESFSSKKPVLMALGVFGVGFLLGRSGRKS